MTLATISPGGATTLATASGANFGFKRSRPLIAGIAAGIASMAALAAAGLAAVLLAVPSLQLIMKAAGSVCLLWLAWQTASCGPPNLTTRVMRPTSFLGGVRLLWVNPKGWGMTLGAAASSGSLSLWCVPGSFWRVCSAPKRSGGRSTSAWAWCSRRPPCRSARVTAALSTCTRRTPGLAV